MSWIQLSNTGVDISGVTSGNDFLVDQSYNAAAMERIFFATRVKGYLCVQNTGVATQDLKEMLVEAGLVVEDTAGAFLHDSAHEYEHDTDAEQTSLESLVAGRKIMERLLTVWPMSISRYSDGGVVKHADISRALIRVNEKLPGKIAIGPTRGLGLSVYNSGSDTWTTLSISYFLKIFGGWESVSDGKI